MASLFIGYGFVGLYLRHAITLKDKRQIVKSIIQKLKNDGFSVSEFPPSDEPKQGGIGFSFTSSKYAFVEEMLKASEKYFRGDFDLTIVETGIHEVNLSP